MAGLDPAIHTFAAPKNVDARHTAGHDGVVGDALRSKRYLIGGAY
jgi:hypothetical protein